MSQKIQVLLVQQFFRFYRTNLFKRLAALPDVELTMIHGTNPPVKADVAGLNMGDASAMPFEVFPSHIDCLQIGRQQVFWFSKAKQLIRKRRFEVVISDFTLRLLSMHAMIRLQHRQQGGFLFWDIGLPLKPSRLVIMLRKRFYTMADGIILYHEREKARLMQYGISPEKLFVAKNTVDIQRITAAMQATTLEMTQKCQVQLGGSVGPMLLHVGRLAAFKRLDILLEAVAHLKPKWPTIRLVLIGDGPQRDCLVQRTETLGLKANVLFTGGITDPEKLAPWFAMAKVVVAPAQIGLLAPETHAYGRPLVTSDDPTISGPEAQILKLGVTGETYHFGNVNDLVHVLDKLLCQPDVAEQYGKNGLRRAREILGIDKQVDSFHRAITTVTARYREAP